MSIKDRIDAFSESVEETFEFCKPKDGETKEEAQARVKSENYRAGLEILDRRLKKIAFYEECLLRAENESEADVIKQYVTDTLEKHRKAYSAMGDSDFKNEMLMDVVEDILGGM